MKRFGHAIKTSNRLNFESSTPNKRFLDGEHLKNISVTKGSWEKSLSNGFLSITPN